MSLPTLRFTRPIVGRAVYIQIVPRPANIARRREIFRLLSRFGELQFYRSQRYDLDPIHNGALLIFKEERAATECVQQSPIRFRLSSENRDHGPEYEAMKSLKAAGVETAEVYTASDNALPKAPRQQPILPYGYVDDASEDPTTLYQVTANYAAADPMMRVEMSPFHGHFKPNATSVSTVPYEDLWNRVPARHMADLAWKQRKRPMRDIIAEREQDERGPNAQVPLAVYESRYRAKQEVGASNLEAKDPRPFAQSTSHDDESTG